MDSLQRTGQRLVESVRDAARQHNHSWERLVPDAFTVNHDAEEEEEQAYAEMAASSVAGVERPQILAVGMNAMSRHAGANASR